jgi:hypothetical protein
MREAEAMILFTGDVEFQEKLLDVKFDFTCFWSNGRPFSRLLFFIWIFFPVFFVACSCSWSQLIRKSPMHLLSKINQSEPEYCSRVIQSRHVASPWGS